VASLRVETSNPLGYAVSLDRKNPVFVDMVLHGSLVALLATCYFTCRTATSLTITNSGWLNSGRQRSLHSTSGVVAAALGKISNSTGANVETIGAVFIALNRNYIVTILFC